ncbi:MAG: ester cyclase [Deltaproteobacteria bacterium]|nr:ester cyclase [Deltaproteobacteria bacterium]MCW5805056.1 ester cyclase [Deltaproteobacteria bacterium]
MRAAASIAWVLAAACARKDNPEMMATPGQSGAMGRNAEMGSAMVGSGSASVGEPLTGTWPLAPPPPPRKQTPAELAATVEACLAHGNANELDALAACYGASAVLTIAGARVPPPSLVGPANITAQVAAERAGYPDLRADVQLAIASGRDVVAIVRVAGTHTGVVAAGPEARTGGFDVPLRDAPATNKKFGYLSANVITFDDANRIDSETRFFDAATQLGQLGVTKASVRAIAEPWPAGKQILVPRGDDAERANQAAYGRFNEALNRHDTAAIGNALADNLVWSEQASPSDRDRKGYLAHLAQLWRSYSDLRFGALKVWAAGDYVIAVESFAGRNDGDLPGPKGGGPIPRTLATVNLPMLAVYRFAHGKIAQAWTFHQSTGLAAQLVPAKKRR